MSEANSQPSKKKKGLNIWAASAFAGVLVLLVLVGARLFQNETSPVRLGEKPEDFSLASYSGEVIDTINLRGKVVLINFWASWCATCDEEALLLEEAWQVYQTDGFDQVVFLGIAYMDTEPASWAYLAEYGVTFPNGPDLRGAISKIYQVKSVPETFILDTEGRLGYRKIGSFASLEEILAAVDSIIATGIE